MSPDPEQYLTLLACLRHANAEAEKGRDRLECIQFCLVAVLQFLDADPEVSERSDTQLLGSLTAAVYDVVRGGKPRLLYARKRQSHAPSDQSFAQVQGVCAAVLTLLIAAGEPRESAGRFAANLLRRAGIRNRQGKEIDYRQILRWRDEIGVRAPTLSTDVCNDTLARFRNTAPPGALESRDGCRRIVEAAVDAFVLQGFRF